VQQKNNPGLPGLIEVFANIVAAASSDISTSIPGGYIIPLVRKNLPSLKKCDLPHSQRCLLQHRFVRGLP
jgi:hypothetical protein